MIVNYTNITEDFFSIESLQYTNYFRLHKLTYGIVHTEKYAKLKTNHEILKHMRHNKIIMLYI